MLKNKLFQRIFPELLSWIKETITDVIFFFKNLKVAYLSKNKLECDLILKSRQHDFLIEVIKPNEKVPYGYLSVMFSNGNEKGSSDLLDGEYSKDVWEAIVHAIIRLEGSN